MRGLRRRWLRVVVQFSSIFSLSRSFSSFPPVHFRHTQSRTATAIMLKVKAIARFLTAHALFYVILRKSGSSWQASSCMCPLRIYCGRKEKSGGMRARKKKSRTSRRFVLIDINFICRLLMQRIGLRPRIQVKRTR